MHNIYPVPHVDMYVTESRSTRVVGFTIDLVLSVVDRAYI